ncbi:MAG: hypothetical protein MMC23_002023 [Stictis urceolatum]|nr:hypothetical protein [Stictis urceolata]
MADTSATSLLIQALPSLFPDDLDTQECISHLVEQFHEAVEDETVNGIRSGNCLLAFRMNPSNHYRLQDLQNVMASTSRAKVKRVRADAALREAIVGDSAFADWIETPAGLAVLEAISGVTI